MNTITAPEEYATLIEADSDQINAIDLIGGPRIYTIESVHRQVYEGKEKVVCKLRGEQRLWRTSKGMARLLAELWGLPDSSAAWAGRRVELYCEPSIRFGKEEKGGVRVCGLSHIDREATVNVAESRTRTMRYKVRALKAEPPAPTLDSLGLTIAQIDAWRASEGKSPFGELTVDQQSRLIAWLAADEKRVAAVREAA